MSVELAYKSSLKEQYSTIRDLGSLGDPLGAGFHARIYEFFPYQNSSFSTNTPWVAKLPFPYLNRLEQMNLGYHYEDEIAQSQDILTRANQMGIDIPFVKMYEIGEGDNFALIQKRCVGGHPRINDPEFNNVLQQVLEWNRMLKETFDAEIDLFHFAKDIFKNGLSHNTPLDGFMYENAGDTIPTLVDCQLVIMNETDPIPVRKFKNGLRGFNKHVIEAAWRLNNHWGE